MPGAAILQLGLATAVGDSAEQTASSVRAGISRYGSGPVMNRHVRPMTLALLPEEVLPPLSAELDRPPHPGARERRMLRLASLAFGPATKGLPPGAGVPLFLALPEARPGGTGVSAEAFLDRLSRQVGGGFERAASRVFPAGRAGGLLALAEAVRLLQGGSRSFALVGGVDTHLDLRLLSELDAEDRVLAEGVMDGFAPGEGAAFLLLASESALSRTGMTPLARVHPPGAGKEAGHLGSPAPYTGDGLAEAVTAALVPAAGTPVRSVMASLNGESMGAKEWGVAYMRNTAAFAPDVRLEHPAECYGDVGAATAPILLGIAALGLSKGWLPGPCLVWSSSDGEDRAAACVTLWNEGGA